MRLRGAWTTWGTVIVLAACGFAGCSSPEPETKEAGPPTFEGVQLRLGVLGDPAVLAGVTAARGEWTASRRAELEIAADPVSDVTKPGDFDVIVFPGQAMGDLIDHDLLEVIPNSAVIPAPPEADPLRPNARKEPGDEAPEDPYQYEDLAPVFREQVARYGMDRYGLPLGGSVLVLVYRRDVFESEAVKKAAKEQGLTLEAPETWAAFDALARFFQGRDWDGDGSPDFGLAAALGDDAEGVADAVYLARAAGPGQHRDQYSFLFDTDAMTPRIDAPPFVEALGAVVGWKALGPPGAEAFDAAAARKAFRDGKTALLIDRAERAGDWGNTAARPLGVAQLPGSERVYEPLRKDWEAVDTVNKPAYLPVGGGWLVGVRSGLETAKKEAAIDLARYLSGPEVSPRLRAEHGFPMAPVRSSQMGQGPPDPASAPDVDPRLWSNAISRSLMALRVLPGVRIPQADGYLADLAKGRAAALAGKEPEAALREVAAAWSERTKTLGVQRQLWHYRCSLNKLPTLPQPPERGE